MTTKQKIHEMAEWLKDNYTAISKLDAIKKLRFNFPNNSLNLNVKAYNIAYDC